MANTNTYYKKLAKDVLIVIGLTMLAGFSAGLVLGSKVSTTQGLMIVGLLNLVFIIVGFVIVGVRSQVQRLKHLTIVAFSLWLISVLNLFFNEFTFKSWLLALPLILLLMLISFGISMLIKPPPKDVT